MDELPLAHKTVLLGVCGSVAAYRAADLARELMRRGAAVHVALTSHALKFVTLDLFTALTGNPAVTDTFDEPVPGRMAHIDLPAAADLFLVAPATAHTLAKFANGLADDMLSTAFLANTAPVLLAPAMNPKMLAHPATQTNLNILRDRGCAFVDPSFGTVACGDEGVGKLADIQQIISAVERILSAHAVQRDFEGCKALVTAGPTYEDIDPVRFIGNRSSGKMGYAIAEALKERGAEVVLVTGPTNLAAPCIDVIRVRSAVEMLEAVSSRFDACDMLIAAAAVADFRPAFPAESKIKREGMTDGRLTIDLSPNPDILAEMGRRRANQVLVGFAAETGDLVENARKKAQEKAVDLIAANDVTQLGSGFDIETNQLMLVRPDGRVTELPIVSKRRAADLLLDEIARLPRFAPTA